MAISEPVKALTAAIMMIILGIIMAVVLAAVFVVPRRPTLRTEVETLNVLVCNEKDVLSVPDDASIIFRRGAYETIGSGLMTYTPKPGEVCKVQRRNQLFKFHIVLVQK